MSTPRLFRVTFDCTEFNYELGGCKHPDMVSVTRIAPTIRFVQTPISWPECKEQTYTPKLEVVPMLRIVQDHNLDMKLCNDVFNETALRVGEVRRMQPGEQIELLLMSRGFDDQLNSLHRVVNMESVADVAKDFQRLIFTKGASGVISGSKTTRTGGENKSFIFDVLIGNCWVDTETEPAPLHDEMFVGVSGPALKWVDLQAKDYRMSYNPPHDCLYEYVEAESDEDVLYVEAESEDEPSKFGVSFYLPPE